MNKEEKQKIQIAIDYIELGLRTRYIGHCVSTQNGIRILKNLSN